MCRRVITHVMHHDVRTPMIVDVCQPSPAVYANPLRTTHHRCEVDLERIRRDMGLPRLGEQCEYHDCCLAKEDVWICRQHDDDDNDHEPEECSFFVLEHRHAPLCTWEVVAGWARTAGWPEPSVLPAAAWHPYAELAWGRDWQPVYRRDGALFTRWQEAVFSLGEDLHRARADKAVQEAVLLDITGCGLAASWQDKEQAVDNFFGVARALCLLEMRIFESVSLAAARA